MPRKVTKKNDIQYAELRTAMRIVRREERKLEDLDTLGTQEAYYKQEDLLKVALDNLSKCAFHRLTKSELVDVMILFNRHRPAPLHVLLSRLASAKHQGSKED